MVPSQEQFCSCDIGQGPIRTASALMVTHLYPLTFMVASPKMALIRFRALDFNALQPQGRTLRAPKM
jgi:hypothetical protein